jgi:bifunctional non-homologous end joining protein LigD
MKAPKPPSGALWLHEIKHDGFRVIARKDGARVKLYSRPGNDLTDRFSLIVEALARLRSQSCIIDGEAVACDERGIAAFELIRYRRNDGCVFLYAFDLIELNGDDLRRDPLVVRKATLTSVLAKAAPGIRFNEHLEFDDGEAVFHHACRMGLEGIVSKRKDSPYRSGRSPACEALRRTRAPSTSPCGLAPSINAKLAFTAISQIPLFGSRAAAISCCSEAPTNALEAVPVSFYNLVGKGAQEGLVGWTHPSF